jgi:hypothetical protein
MPVTPTYPGIYIQELPSLVHTITAAPTSITVFVGYTNPFYSDTTFNTALQLFSFADYQTNFGGFFSCPWQPDYVGQAVSQFFQNGGQTCYVVALQATDYFSSPGGQSAGTVSAASATLEGTGGTIVFTATQSVGVADATAATGTAGTAMTVTLSNLQKSAGATSTDTADIVVSYGTTVETYRQVKLADLAPVTPPQKSKSPLQNSNLVTVTLNEAPTAFPAGSYSLGYTLPGQVAPKPDFSVVDPAQFVSVFDEFASLDKVPIFNLLAIPGISFPAVTAAAVAYCERKRAFYIVDTPSSQSSGWDVNSVIKDLDQSTPLTPAPPLSTNAAVYYPWLQTTDPVTQAAILQPPSGFVAGIYAQTDNAQGVWQSPAGLQTALNGTTGVDTNGVMTDAQQGVLNDKAINCLRQFPPIPPVVWGGRTTAAVDLAYQQWKYVAVRRMALFIEQTLYTNLTWAVFQGNAAPLWNALTQEVSAFMLSLFRQNAFAGTTPKDSFLVQCNATTTTQQDIDNGVVNILVGFAPLKPAEFVVVQIAQLAGQTQS